MNKLDLSNPQDRVFAAILKRQAIEAGDTPYLVNDEVSITFAEAEDITNRLATGLEKLGISRGDRVAMYMGNRPETVLIALAVNKVGAIWTPICSDYKGAWLSDTLERCEASLLVTDSEHLPRLTDHCLDLLENIPLVLLECGETEGASPVATYAQLAQSEPRANEPGGASAGDLCAILWTSGTTGRSKGVMQCYNNWTRAISKGASQQFNSQEGDIIYCTLPLYNSGAWITSILRALIEGIPVVIEQKFSVTHFWERVDKFKATQTFILGAMGVFLLNTPEQESDRDTTLRLAQIVPFPPHLWATFTERFNCGLVRTGLGQSECLGVFTQIEDREDVPVYALGFPFDDTDIALLDDEGKPVADGQVGEIAIREREDNVLFKGYFNDPAATARAYHGDWYLTGDMGLRDPANGAYFYKDRKKDAVRFGGRNISTLEVESVVRQHPDVRDCAAFGIPSKEVESEDELKINIVLAEGTSPSHEEIASFINHNAPYYFVPRYMEFVTELPYTPNQKVQKYQLREQGVSEATWDLKNSDYRVSR